MPYGKGRDPIVWSIINEEPAWISLHKITAGVDEGSIFYQEEVLYDLPISGSELYKEVETRFWQVFNETWASIRSAYLTLPEQRNPLNLKTNKKKNL